MNYIISGIQQIGIGVKNTPEAWAWYRQILGANVPVFDEAAVAGLMLPYTGGEPQARHAILAMNMQGGGGFEIWQYTQRTPQAAKFDIQLGDLGIFAPKIKCLDAPHTFRIFKEKEVEILSEKVETAPDGSRFFWIKDPFGNVLQIIESPDWFARDGKMTGGVYGAWLGTTEMARTMPLFRDILGYDQVVYDEKKVFPDLLSLSGGQTMCRRVLLRHSEPRKGAFSQLLGATEIELVQVEERTPKKIFQDRFWGELGFIHLCFDINGMDALKNRLNTEGYPFTVDSADSFDMGEAAGRFAYIEDADGTLIEFVETHKVPILKKIGWYLKLTDRDPAKPLPRFMLKAMGLNRKKD